MRYSVLYSLPQPLPPAGAPVSVESGTLFRDNEAHCLILQLGLKNCAPRPISAVQIRVTVFSAQGGVQRTINYQYSGLNALPGAEFGKEVSIGIPDCDAASFTVSVQRVGFAGSEAVFSGGGSKPKQPALVSGSWVPILLAAIAVAGRMVFGLWESVPLISDTGVYQDTGIYQLLTAFVLPVLCCIFARKGGKICKTLSIVCYAVFGIQLLAGLTAIVLVFAGSGFDVFNFLPYFNGSELFLALYPEALYPDYYFSILYRIFSALPLLCFIAKNFVAGMLLNKAYKAG